MTTPQKEFEAGMKLVKQWKDEGLLDDAGVKEEVARLKANRRAEEHLQHEHGGIQQQGSSSRSAETSVWKSLAGINGHLCGRMPYSRLARWIPLSVVLSLFLSSMALMSFRKHLFMGETSVYHQNLLALGDAQSLHYKSTEPTASETGIRLPSSPHAATHSTLQAEKRIQIPIAFNATQNAHMQAAFDADRAELEATLTAKGFKKLEGFSSQVPEQVGVYLQLFAQAGSVAEIGFNAGHSTLTMLSANSSMEVQSFDLGEHKYSKHAFEFLKRKFAHKGTNMSVDWGSSLVTVPAFHARNPDKKYDIVIVDGGHSFKVCHQDVLNMRALAKPDALLVVDDTPCEAIYCVDTCVAALIQSEVIILEKAYPAGKRRGFTLFRYRNVSQSRDAQSLQYKSTDPTASETGKRLPSSPHAATHSTIQAEKRIQIPIASNATQNVHMQASFDADRAELEATLTAKGFKKLEGFSSQVPEQVGVYLQLFAQAGSVAEIGFNAGHSTLTMLSANSSMEVQSFDLGEHKYSKHAFEFLKRKFAHKGANMSVDWGSSLVTVPAFHARNPDKKYDIVIVDGGHSFKVCHQDVLNMRALAKPDALLVVDDTPCEAIYCVDTCVAALIQSEVIILEKAYPAGKRRGFSLFRYTNV